VNACETYFPGDLYRWEVPAVGMFLWVALNEKTASARRPHLSTDKAISGTLTREESILKGSRQWSAHQQR